MREEAAEREPKLASIKIGSTPADWEFVWDVFDEHSVGARSLIWHSTRLPSLMPGLRVEAQCQGVTSLLPNLMTTP